MPQSDVRELRRIVLELAREPGHPTGDRAERYTIIAPLTDDGLIDSEAWKGLKERCRVVRESPDEDRAIGHLVRGAGGRWILTYDVEGDVEDEAGFRFDEERFVAGEYVSIEREDGVHVFRVVVSAAV